MPFSFVQSEPSIANAVDAAGRWLLNSGIQDASGGVARFCELAGGGNRAISNEITGYVASGYAVLFEFSGEARYREAAARTARFLTQQAWRPDLGTFPFENQSPVSPAYFFDCGIMVRGLMAVHRITGAAEFRSVAECAARAMARDFLTPQAIHPVVDLPSRLPLPYEPRWSRRPGCFLLKAALAWRILPELAPHFDTALAQALADWENFLGAPDDPGVMDRLHAFSYFLEALLFVADRPGIASVLERGLDLATEIRDAMAPHFARSDVYAQMLRVRLWSGLPVDERLADNEFAAVMSFRDFRTDVRAEGGFYFGRKAGDPMPFSNPVSTVFCLQAVTLYEAWRSGRNLPPAETLI